MPAPRIIPGPGGANAPGRAQAALSQAEAQEPTGAPTGEPCPDDAPATTGSKSFHYGGPGQEYEFIVTLTQEGDAIVAQIEVISGPIDFNAIYWAGADDLPAGDLGTLAPAQNMNGSGVDWNGALDIAVPGLGNPAREDPLYLQSGEVSDSFVLVEGATLDQIEQLGIRATSIGEDGLSIKDVATGEDCPPDDPDDPDEPVELAEKLVIFVVREDFDPDALDWSDPASYPYQSYLIQKTDESPFTDEDVSAAILTFQEEFGLAPEDIAGIGLVDGSGDPDAFSLEVVSFDAEAHSQDDLAGSYNGWFFLRWDAEADSMELISSPDHVEIEGIPLAGSWSADPIAEDEEEDGANDATHVFA